MNLTITSTVVTICTTSLTFCPHSLFMCFVWIWEQTAIISLYSINWLVFVTQTGCDYCAVRTFLFILDNRILLIKCYLGNFVLNAVTLNINRPVSSGEAQWILSGRNEYLLFAGTSRYTGRAMAQAVSRQPLTVQGRFQCQVSSWVICDGKSDAETGFPPSTPFFHCQ